MTVAEIGPLLVEDPRILVPGRLDAPSVLDTTELRWFVRAPMPIAMGSWFARWTGVLEERCDTYLLGGRCDVGVKRRFRETLELKVRQEVDGQVEFGEGLVGSLEVWRRWSPAEGLVGDCADGRWVDVCKSIVKRRFSNDGTEIAYSSDAPVPSAGCDVEVAKVTVGLARWWTFAFAAFGPPATRREALLASWERLVEFAPCPERFGPSASWAMGYPEWLARTVSPT